MEKNLIRIIDSLFVGCYVYDNIVPTDKGIKHKIFVDPRRTLLYEDSNSLRDCNTNEEVSFTYYSSSYTDNNKNDNRVKLVSYVMPFKSFAQTLMGVEVDTIDMEKAKLMVGFYNMTASKKFLLNTDEELAEEQVKKYVYRKRLD